MDGAFANMAPSLVKALSERRWDVLTVVQSHAAEMIDYVPRHLVSVLVMHDIRARVFERHAQVAQSGAERRRLVREARSYREFERAYCQKFDLVVTVSGEDAQWVATHYRPRRVYALKLPVDAEYFAPRSPALERHGRILFTGLLNHPPNVDAAIYFARSVLPRVHERLPHAEFHVVGRNPDPAVTSLGSLRNVQVFPDVPDIRTHLAEASVVVAPIRYGSGARQKILEAWSMEKCVVATTIGAEGLECRAGHNVLVADDEQSLSDVVVTALTRKELRERIRTSGRAVVCTHHDPPRLADAYLAELKHVAAEASAGDRAMRVLLDMRWMIPGLAGGLENLARSFFLQLMDLDRHNSYTAIVPARCSYDFNLQNHANIRMISVDSAAALARREWVRWRGRLRAALRLPDCRTPEVSALRWLADAGAEVAVSFPGYIHSDLYPLRHVLVVPDIQHEYLPEFFTPAALAERRRIYTDSARRADHICAISEFTRRTLIEKIGVPAEKVTTVPLAADSIFTPEGSEAGETDRVLGKYRLNRGYLYFPAHTWHHKNHLAAIEAFRILRDRGVTDAVLVCSGEPREAQPALESAIGKAGLQDQVRFLGYCPRRDLPSLYRGAGCLFFPSLFEGFGMPVLEAMASGCPAVCSNTTSLPEIAAGAALLVDPKDPEAMASALQTVLTDPDLRGHMVERGLRRAADFSWRRYTLETIAIIRRVHDLRACWSSHQTA
jgi:glycosyltransferase involved in cell wall biosynthesis